MKLAIGTAQFGMNYGVANSIGQPDQNLASSIISYAKSNGIDTIDTAIAYGESEKILGKVGVTDLNIITKLPEKPNNVSNVARWVNEQVESSLIRLGKSSLSALLLHRPHQLLESDNKDLWHTLLQLKSDKIVEKIGFSIYSPDELDKLWGSFQPDIFQAPYNIFDRRLTNSGWLKRANEAGVEVHIRSIFLQGLLLMTKKNRPLKFNQWSKHWHKWDKWLNTIDVSPLQASLAFSRSDDRISKIVIGVESLDQIKQILSANSSIINEFPEELSSGDLQLIEPFNWNIL
jgi:aryl-alcohol dehydrogenase-like predicted oxidoreductase